MEKRNLFEQMNTSAYENSTDPFAALYEAGHFGNLDAHQTATSDEDPETGSFRNGEPAKITHKMTPEEMERQRNESNGLDTEAEFETPISGSGRSRKNEEVPLEYHAEVDGASDIDGDRLEGFDTVSDLDDIDSDYDTKLTDDTFGEDDADIFGYGEPGPGGEAGGTVSTKLPTTLQSELADVLDNNALNRDELLAVLADFMKKATKSPMTEGFAKNLALAGGLALSGRGAQAQTTPQVATTQPQANEKQALDKIFVKPINITCDDKDDGNVASKLINKGLRTILQQQLLHKISDNVVTIDVDGTLEGGFAKTTLNLTLKITRPNTNSENVDVVAMLHATGISRGVHIDSDPVIHTVVEDALKQLQQQISTGKY